MPAVDEGAARLAVPALSVLLAAVLLAAVAVAARGPDPATAGTVLVRGAQVRVELADGGSRALAPGDDVPRGGLVRPGRDGAVLRVLGRDTWLSGDGALLVRDGARQELRSGLVMVDARRGPALELATAAAVVTTPRGAVARVERAALVRVGAYGGDAVQVRAAGRRATTAVARDFQVQVPDGGVAGRPTPLVLTPGDAYERALAPDLVDADDALTALGRELDRDAARAGAVRAAALRDDAGPTACGDDPASERALAFVLAAARDRGRLHDRFVRTCALRADGGSWGVVADLVGTRVADAGALLAQLLAGPGTPALAAGAGSPASAAGLLAPASGASSPAGPAAGTPAPAGSAAPAPAGGPTPDAPPAPPAPADPTPLLGAVVDAVVRALPALPVPVPTGDARVGTATGTGVPALPGDPVPSPTPTPAAGLLGGLLGR